MAGVGTLTRDSQLLHTLSNGLAELYQPDGGDFPSRVISLVSGLVPADSCSYNHLIGPVAVAIQIEPADALDFPDAEQLFQQHLHEHPLLEHTEATGDLSARRISDVASDRQFRGLGLYHEFYRPAQVDHQLVVSVLAPYGGMISVALNRCGQDFSDQQRDVVDLLRPHLAQASAIASLLSQPVPDSPRDAHGRPLLTPRQTRILQLVAAGNPDRAVARTLGVSVRTVHTHLQHIYRALGVSSRTEALAHVRALSLARTQLPG
ncbi:MAG TPA: LuxR C-terminal-related transcriptional regulator [Streptosporangiaceae bacterium]